MNQEYLITEDVKAFFQQDTSHNTSQGMILKRQLPHSFNNSTRHLDSLLTILSLLVTFDRL